MGMRYWTKILIYQTLSTLLSFFLHFGALSIISGNRLKQIITHETVFYKYSVVMDVMAYGMFYHIIFQGHIFLADIHYFDISFHTGA